MGLLTSLMLHINLSIPGSQTLTQHFSAVNYKLIKDTTFRLRGTAIHRLPDLTTGL